MKYIEFRFSINEKANICWEIEDKKFKFMMTPIHENESMDMYLALIEANTYRARLIGYVTFVTV